MINKQDDKEINFIEDDIHSLDEEDQMAQMVFGLMKPKKRNKIYL